MASESALTATALLIASGIAPGAGRDPGSHHYKPRCDVSLRADSRAVRMEAECANSAENIWAEIENQERAGGVIALARPLLPNCRASAAQRLRPMHLWSIPRGGPLTKESRG
jgi:hypothetical protein